jgi:hypothetical protein
MLSGLGSRRINWFLQQAGCHAEQKDQNRGRGLRDRLDYYFLVIVEM